MASKFKIGEWVKVTSMKDNHVYLPVGTLFRINSMDESKHSDVEYWVYPASDNGFGISQYSVELAEDFILKEIWKDT